MGATQTELPRARIERLRDQVGEAAVVRGCLQMLAERDVDDAVVDALGGEGARRFLTFDVHRYWGRVWGARGLLYVWGDVAIPALERATRDEHWRVREMVAKVVAKHRVDALDGDVAALRYDPVPRVRAAAERALMALARQASTAHGRPSNPPRR